MRQSEFYLHTLKEVPAEAEVASHQLLLRGGFIRKVAAGIYTYLPAGMRVLNKVINIVREEMNRFGAQELLMPALQPKELWEKTGRWDAYGPMMMKLKDRKNRGFALGPTHEELITTLVQNDVRSYRELPFNLYQIQTKFRDEPRPRFGLIRAREFLMKDAYSFDRDREGLMESYEKMRKAYHNVFTRCGLRYRTVQAHAGLIGGSVTEEFMALADIGEDIILYCESCGYSANRELARSSFQYSWPQSDEPYRVVETPGKKTVEEVSSFLGVKPELLVKTMIYRSENGYVAAVVPGDREAVETKVATAAGVENVELISPEEFDSLSVPFGYAGPIGLKQLLENVTIIMDTRLKGATGVVVGANKPDAHIVNASAERDFDVDLIADIAEARGGDTCPECSGTLTEEHAIEVGHIFQLGTSYSEKLGAYFLDADGERKPFYMGCYGIGVSRILAAVVEQNHDQRGIYWPVSIAPFDVHVLLLNTEDETLCEAAEEVYAHLINAGFDVLYDDRLDTTPGSKFADADLLGVPVQLVIGKKFSSTGEVEIKIRRTGERLSLPPQGITDWLKEFRQKEFERLSPPYSA